MKESGWGTTCLQSIRCHFVVRIFFYEPEPPFIRISSFKQYLVARNKLSNSKTWHVKWQPYILEASGSSANQWGHLGGQMENCLRMEFIMEGNSNKCED